MANHVFRKSAPIGVLPSCLSELRQHALAALIGSPLFSEAEQLRANHFVHETEDMVRFTHWHALVLAEITRREAAAARQRGQATLRATLRRLRSTGFRSYRPHKPQPTPTCAPGAPVPDRADRHAGTLDCRAAAYFVPGQSLTLASLLTRPRP